MKLAPPSLGGTLSCLHLGITAILVLTLNSGRYPVLDWMVFPVLRLGECLFSLAVQWFHLPRALGLPPDSACVQVLAFPVLCAVNSFVVGYGLAGLVRAIQGARRGSKTGPREPPMRTAG